MSEVASPRAVHCPNCHRFMFNIRLMAAAPQVGAFAQITDFKCGRCGHTSLVLLGVADKDKRSDKERVEEKLVAQMLAEQ